MDTLVAGVLFVVVAIFLVQRQLGSMLVWVVLAYLVGKYGLNMNHTFSVVLGLVVVYLISMVTKENFENEEDEPAPKKGKTPRASSS
jgi:Na+(H+)/acetate symporter ActP